MRLLKSIAAIAALTLCAGASATGSHSFGFWRGAPVVYTQTNAAAGNQVLVLRREHDGELRLISKASTRGLGTDAGLGNQGSLALRRDGRRLFVANAGSHDISVFATRKGGLTFIERVPSGGRQPISLALHDDLLYVLNAGDGTTPANITGFYLDEYRRLRPIPDSTRALSMASPDPAQIGFHPWGETLVVTEKATSKIDLFDVQDGVASDAFVRNSAGETPFGFAFDKRGRLIVSEAFGGAPNASAVSSYDIDEAAAPLEVISASVPTNQTAACWIVITKDGRFAYTTNTGSGTISGYRISRRGELTLLDPSGVSGSTGAGSGPIDMALSRDGRFLFSLNSGTGTISSFRVRPDGRLTTVATLQGIPASANGLAAH